MSQIKDGDYKVFSDDFTNFLGSINSFLNTLVGSKFDPSKLDPIEKDIINGILDQIKKSIQ